MTLPSATKSRTCRSEQGSFASSRVGCRTTLPCGDPAELAAVARVLEGWDGGVQDGQHTAIARNLIPSLVRATGDDDAA
jgi:hypothetical protein